MFEILLVNMSVFGAVLLVFVICIYLIACLKSDNSVMDIAYGPAFFCSAIATSFITEIYAPISMFILGAIGIWSTRLAIRIGRKNYGKPEDVRYKNWRTQWSKKGNFYFYVRSFLQINLLQGLIIFVVAMPYIISLSNQSAYFSIWSYAGFGIFIFGLIYESIADWQLDRFLARKRAGTESAVIMTTGLFRYSRRPNYFGESLIWWGLAIIVLPLPFGYLALLSPILITFIVTKVTGPMLEAIFLEKYPEEYRVYMNRTNYFIPGQQNKKP